jgi:hypothetical protein
VRDKGRARILPGRKARFKGLPTTSLDLPPVACGKKMKIKLASWRKTRMVAAAAACVTVNRYKMSGSQSSHCYDS